GTSVYDAVSLVLNEKFANLPGRKAIVMLGDGVDTTSKIKDLRVILGDVDETDTLIYPIQYDTFDDVQKNRRNDAEIRYDDNDKPYVVESPRTKGERDEDYEEAREFLKEIASRTGGRVQRVNSTTNLTAAFARIADELRKTYSLGYYPSSERKPGGRYYIRIRVYRPDLVVRARETYLKPVRK
ncbi:MAG TPA: VWA domain-containing protein, partial [Pyrinomonadaceae bacterium]|nr:VWA domain-containing protein [Pyrinomonadaceae bacterium]